MRTQAPREIELKFELDAADLPRLRDRLEARFGAAPTVAQLTSIYYDTPDQDLRAAGVTLRIRSGSGDSLVQTVKRSRGMNTALFDRDEWETPLPSREPDLEAFVRTPAGAPLASAVAKLAPVFETLVNRTLWQVRERATHIEVALDEGRVVAGHRDAPLAECEIELKRGAAQDLFRLVHTFGDLGSLRPGVLAKSERGYRLLRGKPSRAAKAEPLALHKGMTAAEAFQAIVHACLRHFGLNAPLVVAHRAPEALHQSRVALRRLRSALSLFKDLVADAQYESLKASLRQVAQRLGEARNLDVYLAESARPQAEREADAPGTAAFLAEIERRRAAAYDDAVAQLQSSEFRALLLRLLEWTEVGPWRLDDDPLRTAARAQPLRRFAGAVLAKHRRRVKRQGRQLSALDPEARHRVRIEAKKLRYAAEFFAGLAQRPKAARRHARFMAALEDLQDALGQLNDIQTGHDIALSFTGPAAADTAPTEGLFAASLLSGRQAAQTEVLLEVAEAAHARLVATKRFWRPWLP